MAKTNISLEILHDGGWAEARRYPDDVVMLSGNISGAFRHIPINCCLCGHFSGYIPEFEIIVVKLSLPFGWTSSPVTYSIAGQAIKAINNSHSGFHNLVYCDDHITIGHSGRFETLVSDISLRRALVMGLRTTACNEDKYTRWSRWCMSLDLIFDLETLSASTSTYSKTLRWSSKRYPSRQRRLLELRKGHCFVEWCSGKSRLRRNISSKCSQ
jgi:hypothetical protein